MNIKTQKIAVYVVGSVVLIGALLLFTHCVAVDGKTGTPLPTPSNITVHVPGITEPANTFPCNWGVWDTLKFGVTTEEQLVDWLAESKLVHQPSLGDGWREPSEVVPFRTHVYSWLIVDNNTVFHNSIGLDVISDTLSSLRTPVLYPLTLGEVVEQLGPPESVLLDLIDRYEELAYSYELYYPAQGVVVSGAIYDQTVCEQIDRSEKGSLEITWPVASLTCSAPGTLSTVIRARYGISPQASEQMVKLTQLWEGFGERYLLNP